MAQPKSTEALFDIIANDAIIAPLLGIHVLQNGATRPAIARLWKNETIEATTRQQGVEIAIDRMPIGYAPESCQTGEVILNPTFSIQITQWKPSNNGAYNLQAIIDRLLVILPGSTATNVTIQDLTVGLSQYVLTWQCKVAGLKA